MESARTKPDLNARWFRRCLVAALLISATLPACAQPPPELPEPLPIRVVQTPEAWPQPATPLPADDPRVQRDPQIRQRLHLDDAQSLIYLQTAELRQLPLHPTPPPFVPPSRTSFQFSGWITATMIPYSVQR
ncbi:MAG: hypothetical protein NZ699_07800 [Roseiflexus sp.]|nr:hypothetical protein [Roseiflexus sp.]MDW8148441.1 hypothetical protein [Roseiflexaceae bacterium]MDW8234536.1 hypothetical protein [Roseiflexaceae bacterium]